MTNDTPIASELSYQVWLKQQREQGKPEVSPANRDKFPVQPQAQARPAWFEGFRPKGTR